MEMLFILNGAPYGDERTYNGLRLAGALAKRAGTPVRVFLMGDAAMAAKRGQQVPTGFYNLESMLGRVIRQGDDRVAVCGTCMDVFLTALIGSAVGYAVMLMVMTATPLAMQICGQALGTSATVIQWHVLGMFLPSFFTGNLIRRFGVLPIMAGGIVLLGGHVAIALSGIEFLHFLSGLILLGVGWNFLFIGGTTLLTEAYRPAERAKTQAAHDFLMFGAVSIASSLRRGVTQHLGLAGGQPDGVAVSGCRTHLRGRS